MATAKKKENTMEVPALEFEYMTINIVGDSPLIVHNWSHKAKEEMLGKQMRKASKGKEAKNPMRDFLDSLYWLDENGNLIDPPSELDEATMETPKEEIEKVMSKYRFGFKTVALKESAISGGYWQGLMPNKTVPRSAFHILGEYFVVDGELSMREDMVKIGGQTKVADIRYRPEFRNWRATVTIKYSKNAISREQIVSMLICGGFAVGIGEWRIEKKGPFGTYHVE